MLVLWLQTILGATIFVLHLRKANQRSVYHVYCFC